MFAERLVHWIFLFFIYSFLGWCWESSYVSLKEKKWVNRGFLRGPMIPIYGSGAVILLYADTYLGDNLVLIYVTGVCLATILEYIVGMVMEMIFKVRYWDYSYQKYNLHGYICLSSSITWGFFNILLNEFIQPPIENRVNEINDIYVYMLTFGIGMIFVTDVIISTWAALDIAKAIRNVEAFVAERRMEFKEEIREEMANVRVELANLKQNIIMSGMEKKEEWEEYILKIGEMSDMIQSKSRILNFFRRGLLESHPEAISKYRTAFHNLKENILNKK